ncbi:MAG: hypothetical protein ABSH06_04695 [Thermodesulfobacteriota bacterium]|jgi:hypothetical protein
MIYKDIFGDQIELTSERRFHIVREHPEVSEYSYLFTEVLSDPDYVKKSNRDDDVLLYYKFFENIKYGKYLLIALKKNLRSFILTCYITDVLKKGAAIWEKK